MGKRKRNDDQPEAGSHRHLRKRMPLWLPAVLLVLAIGGVAVGVWAMNRPGVEPELAPPASAVAAAAAVPRLGIPADVSQRLVGRWLRADGGYVLSISSIAEDGTVRAAYNNPRTINVAGARVTNEGGNTLLHVELRDRFYPGNYYTLSYDRARDRLVGDYNHLGIGQTLDVIFERLQ